MKILLFGANGQVGWELSERLAPFGEVIVLTRKGKDGFCGDLTDLQGIKDTILRSKPDIVFNAAAYTAVDKAEVESDVAMLINYKAPEAMANACREVNALLVHYSTDYVFNGQGDRAWSENEKKSPLNIYGLSKAKGEEAIAGSGCSYLIFRTSWVYGRHGKNFVKTMLKLAKTHKELKIVNDQVGAPTSAEFIAQVSMAIALQSKENLNLCGTYHLVPDGSVDWSEFALKIFDELKQLRGCDTPAVRGISTQEYGAPALRPLNSRLNNTKLKSVLPVNCVKTWDYYLSRTLSTLINEF